MAHGLASEIIGGQVAALVVEVLVRYRDFSPEGAGAYSEELLLAFPSSLSGWANAGQPPFYLPLRRLVSLRRSVKGC